MRLLHRIGYYLGGFSIGLIILAFFFSGKRTSCAYFPEARVLKNIRSKPYSISAEARESLERNNLDTTAITEILRYGDVDFGLSETRKEPCGYYVINHELISEKEMTLILLNCEDSVKVQSIALLKD